jgi:hypothetical protein
MISLVLYDNRVCRARFADLPPIKKSQIEAPSERDEQEHRQQPEHQRFELAEPVFGFCSS